MESSQQVIQTAESKTEIPSLEQNQSPQQTPPENLENKNVQNDTNKEEKPTALPNAETNTEIETKDNNQDQNNEIKENDNNASQEKNETKSNKRPLTESEEDSSEKSDSSPSAKKARTDDSEEPYRNSTVFLGNLPSDVTEQMLEDIFSKVGTVKSIKLNKQPETGKVKG
jgi:RNA recognition motif-containing protein